jgi:hypothetical protein
MEWLPSYSASSSPKFYNCMFLTVAVDGDESSTLNWGRYPSSVGVGVEASIL